MLKAPEFKLTVQDTKPDPKKPNDTKMFFLAKGKCNVIIRDKFDERFEQWRGEKLRQNDHFGEISMLYGCPRSATIEADNYVTLATLNP